MIPVSERELARELFNSPMNENKRKFFRIVYPPASNPELVIGDEHFRVTDVSEQGVQFILQRPYTLEIGENLSATLRFGDRGEFTVEGKILRIEPDSAVLVLNRNLPFKHIIDEQRYLIKKFGKKDKKTIYSGFLKIRT